MHFNVCSLFEISRRTQFVQLKLGARIPNQDIDRNKFELPAHKKNLSPLESHTGP